jgi:hypothetical protein
MKRELFIHFSFLISLFILISLVKGWLNLSYWPFWVGGLVGNMLVDVDHFIYVYFLRPHELTSQRVNYMVGKRNLLATFDLLAKTRRERKDLIFHTILFQLVFLVLTIFILTSSQNLLGRGIVLALSIHLLVDQLVDIVEEGNLDTWVKYLPLDFSADGQKIYFYVMAFVVLFISFFL